MECEIHNTKMFEGKYGPVHKTTDPQFPKGWCNGKPKTDYKAVWVDRKSDFVGSLGKEEKAPDWDAKDLRMVRMNALAHATELVKDSSSLIDDQPVKVMEIAELFEMWVYRK